MTDTSPLIVALGSFDGIHLGHQQIIRRASETAAELHGITGVLTYEPLPAQVIYPDFTYVLTPLREKKALLAALGVQYFHLLCFDPGLRKAEPLEFLHRYLVEPLHPAAVVIGHDHRFGGEGAGDAELLRRTLEPLGIRVEVVPEFRLAGMPVRSTSIREHLLLGHVRLAASLLGRPYALAGEVVPGTGTGRRLGFPTVNLRPYERETLVPADGVYACRVEAGGRAFAGVLNIGHRPTFGGETRTIEAHLLNVELVSSPDSAVFQLVDRIRPERRFEHPEELVAQIRADVAVAREMLAESRTSGSIDSQAPSNNL